MLSRRKNPPLQASNARLPQLAHAGVAALTTAALPRFGGGALFLAGCGAGVVHICSLEVSAGGGLGPSTLQYIRLFLAAGRPRCTMQLLTHC